MSVKHTCHSLLGNLQQHPCEEDEIYPDFVFLDNFSLSNGTHGSYDDRNLGQTVHVVQEFSDSKVDILTTQISEILNNKDDIIYSDYLSSADHLHVHKMLSDTEHEIMSEGDESTPAGSLTDDEDDVFPEDDPSYVPGLDLASLASRQDKMRAKGGYRTINIVLGVFTLFLLIRVFYYMWRLYQLHDDVHNWTSDDVEKWLQEVVGLPQYLPVFRKIGVDGNFLPRLALNTDQMIQSQLGITDLNHKNKLILKAMDVVLFGPPTVFYNPLKDALLALAILVAISGLFFSTVQRKKAQVQIDNMLKELDSLQFNEQKFLEIENVLQEAEQKRENVLKEKKNLEKKLKSEIDLAKAEAERLSEERSGTEAEVRRLQLAEEELAQVRSALNNAESKRCDYTRHRELQKHLKVTYKKERQQYNIKKVAAEKQLEEAKQWGLKMKKKKTGMISSLKMIHGNSLEVVENRICNARTSLIDATNDLQELFARWRRIESICNFNITSAEDTEFGSSASLVSENSNNSSSEPAMIRSNSSPTKQFTSSLPRGQSSCPASTSRGQSSSPASTPRGSRLKDSLGFKTSSLKSKEKKKKSRPDHHGSFPNLFTSSNQQEVKLPNGPSNLHRNYSSNMIKDITKVKELTNGHVDSTDSDDSSKWERRRKGKTLWRLVRESRINSDPKWKNLMDSCSAEGI